MILYRGERRNIYREGRRIGAVMLAGRRGKRSPSSTGIRISAALAKYIINAEHDRRMGRPPHHRHGTPPKNRRSAPLASKDILASLTTAREWQVAA